MIYYVLQNHGVSIEVGESKNMSFFSPVLNKNVSIITEDYNSVLANPKKGGYTYIIFQNLKFGAEQIAKVEESCRYNKSYHTNGYESLRIYSC